MKRKRKRMGDRKGERGNGSAKLRRGSLGKCILLRILETADSNTVSMNNIVLGILRREFYLFTFVLHYSDQENPGLEKNG